QNDLEVTRWSADRGFAFAQFNLGLLYYSGEGVPQDHAEAVKWYRKAAEQSFARAQFNLGLMYAKGETVPKDYVLAHLWCNLAASMKPTDEYEQTYVL